MNILRYAQQSLLHYRRTSIGVCAGALLTSMILTGTLLVGDSAGRTLQNIALARLGETDLILNSGDRFFRENLARRLESELSVPVTPILLLNGVGLTSGSETRQVNRVNIIGIDDSFSSFSEDPPIDMNDNEAAINETLAHKLALSIGDEISLRINKPGILPRDAPLSSRIESPYARAVYSVKAVFPDSGIGRFSPRANQITPNNIFINRSSLENKADLEGQANLMLIQYRQDERITIEQASTALQRIWTIEDLGLKLRTYKPHNVFQIESKRVFLDPPFDALADIYTGSLTYMVNAIAMESDGKVESTPYSFVNAIAPSTDRTVSPVPAEMGNNEVLINRWLADRLHAQEKDILSIAYYKIDHLGKLSEATRSFSIFKIIEMEDLRSEEFLAPDFPGLSDVDSCEGWNIGMPMDEELLGDKANEQYWNTYRGTPKLFMTLDAGKAIWGGRFGDMTAIRFPGSSHNAQSVTNLIREHVTPSQLGYSFEPARDKAATSANTAMDLGQLFTGMSSFLIAAALMMTALLFNFGVDQRSEEIGVLLSIGFTRQRIKMLFMLEASIIALISSIAGAASAVLYTRFLLWGLSELWSDAVANSSIEYYAQASTPIVGAVASFAIIMIVIALSVKHKSRAAAHQLLSGTAKLKSEYIPNIFYNRRALTILCSLPAASAAYLMIYASVSGVNPANIFYASGALLLASGISFAAILLSRSNSAATTMTAVNLCIKNAAWRPYRSIALTGVLACGVFVVFSIFAMKQDMTRDVEKTWSGTGGFEIFAEMSLPLLEDINTERGKESYKLHRKPSLDDSTIVAIKVRYGDDASCFNLNRSLSPSILGVDHSLMSELGAFVSRDMKMNPWELLNIQLPDGVIAGLAGDANTAMWGLQKKTGPDKGEIITVIDEQGRERRIKLVGTLPMKLSLFQGTVIVSRESFSALFPSRSGYQMLVADVDEEHAAEAASLLRKKLKRHGIELTTGGDRLMQFYSVEAAYLSMFLALGGLGLVLGTASLGVVLMRNTMERRSELALMRCIGFSQGRVRTLLASEYIYLLIAGMACGIAAALASLLPNLHASAVSIPWRTMIWLASGILVSGILFTFLAIKMATRGSMLSALRKE